MHCNALHKLTTATTTSTVNKKICYCRNGRLMSVLLVDPGADHVRGKGCRLMADDISRRSRSTSELCRNFSVSDDAITGWRHELYSPHTPGSTHYPSSVDCVRRLTGMIPTRLIMFHQWGLIKSFRKVTFRGS